MQNICSRVRPRCLALLEQGCWVNVAVHMPSSADTAAVGLSLTPTRPNHSEHRLRACTHSLSQLHWPTFLPLPPGRPAVEPHLAAIARTNALKWFNRMQVTLQLSCSPHGTTIRSVESVCWEAGPNPSVSSVGEPLPRGNRGDDPSFNHCLKLFLARYPNEWPYH